MTARATIARTATFPACPRGVLAAIVAGIVGPDRFQHDIEVASHSESSAQRGDVKPARSQIMEDCCVFIQQRLDVDELPRPVILLEDALAEREAIGTQILSPSRTSEIVGVCKTQDALLLSPKA
jgi:hypothetical protein